MSKDNNEAKKSLNKTITKMAPAVFTAMIATALGFVALYTSPVPMIQDFGKMLTIGLVISFVLGMFLLIPVLFTRDHFFSIVKEKQLESMNKKATNPKIDKTLDWITKKTISLRWGLIIIAVIAAAYGVWVDIDADAETDVESFMPQDTKELRDIHKLREIVGTTDQVSIVYESDAILSDSTVTWVGELTEGIEKEFPEAVVETRSLTHLIKQMNDENCLTTNHSANKLRIYRKINLNFS